MTSAARSERDQIRAMLADLKMPGSLEAVDAILSEVDGGRLGATDAINRLLAAQINLRNNRRLQAAMRSSRLPAVKTLETFEFSFQPSIKREQIESLHELGFLERKENVVLLGPPGVGKTHLAISLAITAAQRGRRVYYGTLVDLIRSLEEAQAAGQLSRRLAVLTHPSLLVVDEIGYLPISHSAADVYQMAVMQYPVDQGGGHDLIAEHLAPFLEAFVRGQYRGSALVAAVDQLEEQHCAGVRDRQIADLIDHQE